VVNDAGMGAQALVVDREDASPLPRRDEHMEPTTHPLTADRWTDLEAVFMAKMCRKAGFVEVARRRPKRPVVRLVFEAETAGT